MPDVSVPVVEVSSVTGPPPAEQPPRAPLEEARTELLRLAAQLRKEVNRRTLTMYLRARRAAR